MASNKHFSKIPSNLSNNSDANDPPRPYVPNTVTFARRTNSGRYVNYSRDDLDSEIGSVDFNNYTVHMPPTPDNQTTDPSISQKVEEQYVSNSMFTGGFNSTTKAHLMDKVIETETNHPQMAGAKGSSCAIPGCDAKVMTDGRGQDLLPCECDFKICRDCFVDAVKTGGGICPGCKEPYKNTDMTDQGDQQRLPGGEGGGSKMERRLSLMKSNNKSAMVRSQTGDFDQNQWLFETSGTYGYGNAFWTKDGNFGSGKDGDGDGMETQDLMSKPWKPLTRKLNIPAAVLSPYRLLILIRVVVLALFLSWRIKHQNQDAIWLWGMSVVCELWFAFSWLLDQLPKLCPVNRSTDLQVLKEKFETPTPSNPTGKSDLPGLDVFVSTADPEKEPPLVTANTILSILAADYPCEKLACYVSDDGGALLTFEAMAEAASFANIWVPFCRKHTIEPRNPDSYFSLKRDPYKNKVKPDFVKDRRRVKREYDEFKVRINSLPDSIRRRSDAYHAREEIKAMKMQRQNRDDELLEPVKIKKATWMADGTHWPGTWLTSASDHAKGDHAGIIQVMLKPPSDEPLHGDSEGFIDLNDVDIRLPLLVYVSREKRPGYDHNKKAGAMNALVRASAVMSNGAFILNLDCDHYIYNSEAMREGMCFMMDRGGDRLCYVQFPQRFEGIDPSDRYANHNTVFFDVNMRALDGLMGPVYVGTGCLFRRIALYGFDPPRSRERSSGCCGCCFPRGKKKKNHIPEENIALRMGEYDDEEMSLYLVPKKFGNSTFLLDSIPVAEFQGRPLADHPSVKNGRPPGALTIPRELLDASTVAEAIAVISCWYEDKTEWGSRIGWIYGSVTEDVVTGYRMHNRGWKSVYCVTKRDAFRGTAPINLTDRLHQVLRWATGSVEIFFSRNNALLASPKMKILQRIAYLNVGIYPFTSIFLIVYCFLPALSLFSGQFIVQTLNVTFLVYLLIISITLCLLALLEIKWSGISLEEWWRNEQFWLIGGTSAHLAAVLQGLLKVIAGVEISFTLTTKSGGDDVDDEFADLYMVKWTSLMIPPITIMMVNLIAIAVGFSRTIYAVVPQWSKLIGAATLLDAGSDLALSVADSDSVSDSASELVNSPDDPALFLHTSGTTSRPKGVPLTQLNLVSSVKNIKSVYKLTESDSTVIVLPLFHVHGLLAGLLSSLGAGAAVTLPAAGRFSATTFWADMNKYDATWYTAVPTIHQIILDRHASQPEPEYPRLRFIRSCSASLAPVILSRLEEAFGAPVLEAYAMTEATHLMSSNPLPEEGPHKPGSVGKPVGQEMAILNEKGEIQEPNSKGEVCIRGPNVTKGYKNNPDANKAGFEFGWFHTGDIGYFDSDGYLHLVGRIKELINRGGEKISPIEVDSVLLTHPDVSQGVAFGVPDEKYGEEINCAVIPREGTTVTEEDIKTFCKKNLAAFKVPKRVFITDNLPKTASGKIQRRIVAQHFLEKP